MAEYINMSKTFDATITKKKKWLNNFENNGKYCFNFPCLFHSNFPLFIRVIEWISTYS